MSKTHELRPFLLAALCEVGYLLLMGREVRYTAKEAVLAVLCIFVVQTVALYLLTSLRPRYWSARMRCLYQKVVRWGMAVSGIVLLLRILLLYRREYESQGLWLFCLALALLFLAPGWPSMCRISGALLFLAVLGGLPLLTLTGSMRWENLSFDPPRTVGILLAFMQLFYLCPEFLALPLQEVKDTPCRIPVVMLVLELCAVVGAEVLFGWQGETGRFAAVEAVRSCGVGIFTRLDDILIGIWLILALYRLLLQYSLWATSGRGERYGTT